MKRKNATYEALGWKFGNDDDNGRWRLPAAGVLLANKCAKGGY